MCIFVLFFFVSSRRRHTRCALVTGVQTCALPICSGCGCDGRSASTPLFFSAPQRHDPHLRITKLALERRRGYEAGEGEQLAQATSCFHQKVPVTQSEQESTASPHAEDGLNTGAWQLLKAGVTHTNPR